MACFTVPAAEAVIASIASKSAESSNKKGSRIPFSRKLKWLSNMLWGGSALLAFEHIWHGELTYKFPFLTRAAESGSASDMLFEMATTGVMMAAAVTAVWACVLAVTAVFEKRESKKPSEN